MGEASQWLLAMVTKVTLRVKGSLTLRARRPHPAAAPAEEGLGHCGRQAAGPDGWATGLTQQRSSNSSNLFTRPLNFLHCSASYPWGEISVSTFYTTAPLPFFFFKKWWVVLEHDA